MNVLGIHHAQITVPIGKLEEARKFYGGFLHLLETQRPPEFGRGGIWYAVGDRNLHIGMDDSVNRRLNRSHVAYRVDDLDTWRRKVEQAGIEIEDPPTFAGHARFQFRDPFGNQVELIQVLT